MGRCPRPDQGWCIATVTAPFHYRPPLDGHIQALKFRPSRPMGRALGLLLAEVLEDRCDTVGIDVLIPVPLHHRRLCERGFNQAFEIARPVAARTGLPLVIRGIQRQANTRAQTLLAAADRHSNMHGAFGVTRDFKGMNVAIVDDVITTGATVNALAASLRGAGAETIHAWALARAVPKGSAAGLAACDMLI